MHFIKPTDSTLNAERLHAFPIIRNRMRVLALTTVIQYGDGSKVPANYNHRRASRVYGFTCAHCLKTLRAISSLFPRFFQ